MGTGRRKHTFMRSNSAPSSPYQTNNARSFRNLSRTQLGGVIFGCTKTTMKYCLEKQLFGLPAQHFSYVKNVNPGLPLFLFNYSDRKLHGIFEAASSGQMLINPYAWTSDGSGRTQYPAQVQIRVRLQCHPLTENQFKPVILDNYYSHNHFLFELDHAQANKLISKLSSLAFAPSSTPHASANWRSTIQGLPAIDKIEEYGSFEPQDLEYKSSNSVDVNRKLGFGDRYLCPNDGDIQLEAPLDCQDALDEKDFIYMKLKELVLERECSGNLTNWHAEESTNDVNDVSTDQAAFLEAQPPGEEKNEEISCDWSGYPSFVVQLLQGMEELKAFKEEQTQKIGGLEQKLAYADEEIRLLKNRCLMLESLIPSHTHDGEPVVESDNGVHLDDESVILAGGYDGVSWLSSLDSYSPLHDVLKSLKPMTSARSDTALAKLSGGLYVFGGRSGSLSHDTVELYNPADNKWTVHPSLSKKKFSLSGATLKEKIFAIGGGNGIECFSEVELYDPQIGRWIPTRSMRHKRFSLAAAELNGALYAVGGYDGSNYLAYALGGHDGSSMLPSIEIYDPRRGTWMIGEPMNYSRGYSAAAVLKESIYVIGGVQSDGEIVDMIECYKEGRGWQTPNLRAVGKRCFSPAIVLEED